MELHIGEVITAKRKEKGWTQEQLAGAVGVSAPAVSKWETGATYPDITLLAPLARALHITVDTLLAYQSEPSSDEVSALVRKAAKIYESEGLEAGWRYGQTLFEEYPNSVPLRFYLGNMFQHFMIMEPGMDRQKIHAYYRRAADIYEGIRAEKDPKFSYHAAIILVGFYVMLNELDRAEALLDDLPKIKVNLDLLYSSVYSLRGQKEEAIRLSQDSIKRSVHQASQALSLLCAFARADGALDKAHTLAETNLALLSLFSLRKDSAYPEMIKVLTAQDDKQGALHHLSAFAQSIPALHNDCAENPFFNRLTEDAKDSAYLKKVLAQSILADREYDALKDEPMYMQIAASLRTILETEADAPDMLY